MNQSEKRLFLIQSLLNERPSCQKQIIPADSERQNILLRGLMNVRRPVRIGADFLQVQDAYLQDETAAKGITDIADLTPIQPGLYLWQGDITTLKCDAIVNGADMLPNTSLVDGIDCKEVYTIGDCANPFNIALAIRGGNDAGRAV